MKYIKIKDLILGQIKKGKFCKYDILIRYLFVKKYYKTGKKITFHYNLYSKLAMANHTKDRTKSFIRLIKSFEMKGYDENYPLIISDDLHICGGTHRIAICLYMGIKIIPRILNNICKRKRRKFTKEWLKNNGFIPNMSRLNKERKELFRHLDI